MRKINIPRMRWYVGALGHVTHITEIALINHRLIIGFIYLFEFTIGGAIDEIK